MVERRKRKGREGKEEEKRKAFYTLPLVEGFL